MIRWEWIKRKYQPKWCEAAFTAPKYTF